MNKAIHSKHKRGERSQGSRGGQGSQSGQSGFSLVQLSGIVLAAGMVAAAILPSGGGLSDAERYILTQKRLVKIEQATLQMMAREGRRPCPASGEYYPGQADTVPNPDVLLHGVENGTPGDCADGDADGIMTPFDDTNVVAGTVPVHTLALPMDYYYDGWGRPFTYVVDKRATEALSCVQMLTRGDVKVYDGDGGTQIDSVMALYISHGVDGHGAFRSSGDTSPLERRVDSSSTDQDQHNNAGTSASTIDPPDFDPATYNNEWVKKASTATYDDVVWYDEGNKNRCCAGDFCGKSIAALCPLPEGAFTERHDYATFDGVNDYVDTDLTVVGSPSITISAWIRPAAVNTTYAIVGKRGAARTWAFYVRPTGNIGFTLASRGDYNSSDGGLDIGVWQHVVAVVNGTSLTLYRDGSSVYTTTMSDTVLDDATAVDIGASGIGINNFNGGIRDARVYNDALTADEITHLYTDGASGDNPSAANLVGHWPLDDATRNPTTQTARNQALTARSLEFDGTNDYVDIGAHAENIESIAFWVKLDDVGPDTEYVVDLNGTDYLTIEGGVVTANGFSGGTIDIYIDGELSSSTTSSSSPPPGFGSLPASPSGGLGSAGEVVAHAARSVPQCFWKKNGQEHAMLLSRGKQKTLKNFKGRSGQLGLHEKHSEQSAIIHPSGAEGKPWYNPVHVASFLRGVQASLAHLNIIGSAHAQVMPSDRTSVVTPVATGTALSPGVWHHVTVVLGTGFSASDLDIGRKESTGHLDGLLHDIRLYSASLTSNQVKYIYTNGTSGTDPGTSNLASHWKLNDGSGTTATDSAGSNDGTISGAAWSTDLPPHLSSYDGSIEGNPTWASDAPSALDATTSLDFDGTGDYVDVGNPAEFTFGDGSSDEPFSVSFWAKPDDFSTTESQGIITKVGASATAGEWYALWYPQQRRFYLRTVDDSSSGYLGRAADGPTSSAWAHVVMTYDGSAAESGIKIYIDGTEETSYLSATGGSYTAMERTTAALKIGERVAGSGEEFDGDLSDIRVYNEALTAAEITYLYNNGTSGTDPTEEHLVGHWKLNDGSGSVARDVSPLPGSGVVQNVATADLEDFWTTADPYASFDGVDDTIITTHTLVDADVGSIALWFKSSDVTGFEFLVGEASDVRPSIAINGDDIFGYWQTSGGGPVLRVDNVITPGKWHHAVIVGNVPNAELYLDGVSVDTTSSASSSNLSTAIEIGGASVFDTDSSISDVRIYDDILTADEVAYLATQGASDPMDDPGGDNLVAHYKLDEGTDTIIADSGGQCLADATATNIDETAFWNDFSYAEFDGSNDYVLSNTNKMLVGGTPSISLWIRPTGAQSTRGIMQIASGLGSTLPWILFQRTTTSTVRWYVNGSYRISQAVSDNTWYHIVLTYDGTTWRAYKNGVADGSYTGPLGSHTGSSTYLGNGYQGYYRGNMRDVRIYNDVLSADEIAYLYNRGTSGTNPGTSNLVGHWKLNEGSGTTAGDSSPQGNHGTTSVITEADFWNP